MKISIQKEDLYKQMAEAENLRLFKRDIFVAFKNSDKKYREQNIDRINYKDLWESLMSELDECLVRHKIKPRP